MDITIIGAGNMAGGIATRALAGGHSVTVLGAARPARSPASSPATSAPAPSAIR
jgi:3-hydroxyisobutyrate dehydrogenase-like beta-hydroxyacid dehydrogenase